MVNSKIMIEDIDFFKDVKHSSNEFEKYNVLRDISIFDDFMSHQQPGKYRITISIEKVIE